LIYIISLITFSPSKNKKTTKTFQSLKSSFPNIQKFKRIQKPLLLATPVAFKKTAASIYCSCSNSCTRTPQETWFRFKALMFSHG